MTSQWRDFQVPALGVVFPNPFLTCSISEAINSGSVVCISHLTLSKSLIHALSFPPDSIDFIFFRCLPSISFTLSILLLLLCLFGPSLGGFSGRFSPGWRFVGTSAVDEWLLVNWNIGNLAYYSCHHYFLPPPQTPTHRRSTGNTHKTSPMCLILGQVEVFVLIRMV